MRIFQINNTLLSLSLIILLIGRAHAQLPNIALLSNPNQLVDVIELGTIYLNDPGKLNTFISLGFDVISGSSPLFGTFVDSGPFQIPSAVIQGETLITPSLKLLPTIPLVNRPLPGL